MLPKKLVINIAVVVVCTIIALSIPVIVNHLQKPANAAVHNLELVAVVTTNDMIDAHVIWQLQLRKGNQVIKTWDEIYHTLEQKQCFLNYDNQNLQLSCYGLIFPANKTTEGSYHSVVVYQNYQCILQLN